MDKVILREDIHSITVQAGQLLLVVDNGDWDGEAKIIIEPFGRVNYFFVPIKSGVGRQVSGVGLEPEIRNLTTKTCQRTLTIQLYQDSRAEIYGAVLAEHDSHYQFNLIAHHLGARSQSKTLFKAVGKDASSQIFHGMIKIEKQAQQANAFLEHRVLLLSKDATSESNPELEIEANEVKASHAASTGKVDDRQLFYLQSRGIEKGMAELMIVEGFLWEVLENMP